MYNTLKPGMPLFTADQSKLGTTGECHGPFVRVKRRLRRDFWLATEYILWADSERVVMAFPARDFARYRRSQIPEIPRPTGEWWPTRVDRLFASSPGRRHQ